MHTADGVADRFLSDVKEELTVIMKDLSKPVEGKVSACLWYKYLTVQNITPLSFGLSFILPLILCHFSNIIYHKW
jgi:hypothetical protein